MTDPGQYEVVLVGGTQHRYYPASNGLRAAVVYVGGIGGGFDSPALDLYPRLCETLAPLGIGGLRTRFRAPGDLERSTEDVLAGATWLMARGYRRLGLAGHSFGGAVVIRAAHEDPAVRAVVTLASQAYGAQAVSSLDPGVALLAVHGERDEVLPATASTSLVSAASCDAELVLIPEAGHLLDEAAEDLFARVSEFLQEHL